MKAPKIDQIIKRNYNLADTLDIRGTPPSSLAISSSQERSIWPLSSKWSRRHVNLTKAIASYHELPTEGGVAYLLGSGKSAGGRQISSVHA